MAKPILIFDDIFSNIDRRTAEIMYDRLLGDNGVLQAAENTVIMTTNARNYTLDLTFAKFSIMYANLQLVEHLARADFVFRLTADGKLEQIADIATLPQINNQVGAFEFDFEDEEEPEDLIPLQQEQPENGPHQMDILPLFWWYSKSFGLGKLAVWILWVGLTNSLERAPC